MSDEWWAILNYELGITNFQISNNQINKSTIKSAQYSVFSDQFFVLGV